MNKVKEIVVAWATSFNPNEEQKMVAEKRLEICTSCEFWTKNAVGLEICSRCGCATKAKVFSPVGSGACPEKKWTI